MSCQACIDGDPCFPCSPECYEVELAARLLKEDRPRTHYGEGFEATDVSSPEDLKQGIVRMDMKATIAKPLHFITLTVELGE